MRRSPLARSLTAVAAAALVAGALTACTGSPFGGGCDVAPGDASRAISASGELGSTPAVEFPTPLIVDTPEASTLTSGDGEPVGTDAIVFGSTVYYDAASGASLGEADQYFVTGEKGLGFGAALSCATVGSRVAVVGTASDLTAVTQLLQGLGADTTVLAVIDVEKVFLSKANGVNQLPLDGMPTVVTAVDGTPGITTTYLPVLDAPRTSVIKAGGGATVGEDDTVALLARSWNWTSEGVTLGDVDLWGAGLPAVVVPTADALLGEETIADAIVGSKVGSQLLIVIPSSDAPGSATIYVFDVVGLIPADD